MEEKHEKYLPLGSVVLLKGAIKCVMITGFCVKNKQLNDNVYDYLGCVYPEGIIDTDRNLMFNHTDIDKIFALGYSNEEEKKFKEKLTNLMNNN